MENTSEIWKPIKDYEGLYEVSNMGRVRSLNHYVIDKQNAKRFFKGKVLRIYQNEYGYCFVRLVNNSGVKNIRVHRLVAEAFIPNPDNLPEVNHKSEIKTQNNVENLEWCDHKYNMAYSHNSGKIPKKIVVAKNNKTNESRCFLTVKNAANYFQCSNSYMYNCCENNRTYKGYTFGYE
jgi:hypothetical protein